MLENHHFRLSLTVSKQSQKLRGFGATRAGDGYAVTA